MPYLRFCFLMLIVWLTLSACDRTTPSATPSLEAVSTEAAFPAPDFSLMDLQGRTYSLTELRGQWIVLNFWATWCQPCLQEMPLLQQLADDYAETLTVLGVNMQEPTETILSYLEELGVRYPILSSCGSTIALDYQIMALPQTFVINPDGEVVWREVGIITEAFLPRLQAFVE